MESNFKKKRGNTKNNKDIFIEYIIFVLLTCVFF